MKVKDFIEFVRPLTTFSPDTDIDVSFFPGNNLLEISADSDCSRFTVSIKIK